VAICFIRANIISRSNGSSAVAAAAYRSGDKLFDDRLGKTHNYTKKEGVDHSEILTPITATAGNEWLNDRKELWNRVEATEKRYDAQLSRELIIAIPRELNPVNQIALVREYVQNSYVDRGMIADINLHHLDGNNPHAHVMLTMRELKIDERGIVSFGNKDRSWNDKKLLKTQLKEWEVVANKYLENAKAVERIDSRSYAEQGVARIPQIHLGRDVTAMRRRGIPTERGDRYDQIDQANIDIRQNLEQIYESSNTIEIINIREAAAKKEYADKQLRLEQSLKLIAEAEQRQQEERQRREAEILQRQQVEQQQRIDLENQRRDQERQVELKSQQAFQKIKNDIDEATQSNLKNLELKFEQLNQRLKQSKDTIVTSVPEVKETIEPEQPKFTVEWLTAAFTQMRDESSQGQQCKISAVVDNFLVKAVKDDPTNKLGLERMMFRIKDDGRRKGSDFMPLDKLVDEIKFVTEHPSQLTTIQTTRSKDIDNFEPESKSQNRGYSM
jgi:MobA/MobL family